jgi:glycosyltransferase involved in cell wall biosynthesis
LTFIYLEVKKLRELQMSIEFFSIWNWNEDTKSQDAAFLTDETTYLSPPSPGRLIAAHGYYCYRAPQRYLENLRVCFFRHQTLRLHRRTLYNFLLAPYFARILEKRSISHIHAHFAAGAATTAMMAANLLGITYSFTAHGGDVLLDNCLIPQKLTRAKFAVAVSEYNKLRMLQSAPNTRREKIKVIHCGIDQEAFHPVSHVDRKPPVLLAVGSLKEVKGHKYLIEACGVLAANGINFRCIIVGEGPMRKDLEKLIYDHNLRGVVELAGAVPHERLPTFFDRAEIVVHPSISEGIPVALMEAMNKELPVIATRITGIPELINHEEDGLLVSAQNVPELAAAMKKLLYSKDLRMRLGKNARRKIAEHFNLEVSAQNLKQLFEESIERR